MGAIAIPHPVTPLRVGLLGVRKRLYRPESWDDCIVYLSQGRFLAPKGACVESELRGMTETIPGKRWSANYDPVIIFPDGVFIALSSFVFDGPRSDFRVVTDVTPVDHFHWIKFPDVELAQCSYEEVSGTAGYCPLWPEELGT
jgi:hypothetical protein